MSIADKYQDFIVNKPTRERYVELSYAYKVLQAQQNKISRLSSKLTDTLRETRKILEDYKFIV